jgi:hypothetical protein
MPDVGGPISGVGDDLATDPPVSESQRRAMHAAASGKSTLGIPQSVGKEFVESIGEGHGDQTTGTFLDSLRTFLRGLLAWAGEEGQEAEHAPPAPPAEAPEGTDREDAANPLKPALTRELRAANDMALALDQAGGKRTYDKDGRLHVSDCNLTKGIVNPYRGDEIPQAEELGLDPDKTYMLLRHPKELAKPETVNSFNGQPLLWEHKPASAQDHPAEITVGAAGTKARYEHPYIKNDISIWPEYASQAVEDGDKKQISAGYSYDADMTPGVYEGHKFDGVMRNIRCNHLSLVREGRAGPDVMVADSSIADKEWARLEEALLEVM